MSSDPKLDLPDLTDLQLASARIRRQVRHTPVISDPLLDEWAGCHLYLKCENLQRTGSFKFRGASNAVISLDESTNGEKSPVATHSSGNHGAAIALAARINGRQAHVVMPENSVQTKVDAVRRYGGTIHFCEDNHAAREAGLDKLVADGMVPVHPFDRREIIAGQGSCALELLGDHPQIEVLLAPVGGGGLISGCGLAAAERGTSVIGVEPEGAADTVASLEQNKKVETWSPNTIADGLKAIIGVRNFELIRSLVTNVVTVSDDEMKAAQAVAWKYLRLVIEPSSATVLAAIARYPDLFADKNVGVIISGGNVLAQDWIKTIEEFE